MLKIITGEGIAAEIKKIKSREAFDKGYASQVEKIIAEVKQFGDKALLEFTKKFDGVDIAPGNIRVAPDEIKAAYKKVDKEFIAALQEIGTNITEFHNREKEKEWFEPLPEDAVMGMRHIPLESVGIYVPGGRAIYPSSVLMNAIPAKVAGVKRIVMATPPPIDPHVLVAAEELKITEIYKLGGAQAIAALAYGTETVTKVDKIVGPGNLYVTVAKKLVSYEVGIDSLAGPSDILVIADRDAEAEYVAADLLSQCEHDPDSRAILITDFMPLAKKVCDEIEAQIKKLKRKEIIEKSLAGNGVIFVVEKLREAAKLSNEIAPEHLEILVSPPQKILEDIKNAGAVFLGPYSPVALGDYGAGPNHVLPTNGTARFSSPLGVYDFIKKQSVLGYTKGALGKIRKSATKLAEIEGLDAHKRAIDIRFS